MVTDTCGQADGQTAGQTKQGNAIDRVPTWHLDVWLPQRVCLAKVKVTEEGQGKCFHCVP